MSAARADWTVAALLGALHSIPAAEGRAIGLSEVNEEYEAHAQRWRADVLTDARRLSGLDPVVNRALQSLARESVPSAFFRLPLQLIHQDLGTDHIIVHPSSGHVRGIIDWTGAMLGDAARDFVFFVTWQGWEFAETVLKYYPRAVDSAFRTRLRWMARLLSIYWLDVMRESGRDFDSALRGVHNAFAPGEV